MYFSYNHYIIIVLIKRYVDILKCSYGKLIMYRYILCNIYLYRGDIILSINGESIRDKCEEQVMGVIDRCIFY